MSASLRPASSSPRDSPLEVFWDKLARLDAGYRRGYPRLHAKVPVRFFVKPGVTVDLVSNDLSLGGLQVRCDRQTASRLRPDPKANGGKPTYPLAVLLRLEGMSLKVSAHARLVHLTLVPEAAAAEEVVVGVQLVSMDKADKQALVRFIEHHMCPA